MNKVSKVYLTKNPNGDTRTAPKNVTWEEFQKANRMHRADVSRVMWQIANEITNRGELHDFTKITREAEFFENFGEAMNDPDAIFTEMPWYKMHVAAERHHLSNNVPEDVNLIDVIEMLVDIVCATKARKGADAVITIDGLDSELLARAVNNTIYMIDEMTEVVDSEEQVPV